MYGMPRDDYWYNSDYKLLWAYVDAHDMKQKQKRDYDNQLAWLNGLYVRNAVGSIFDGKEYPDPLDFVEMDRWRNLTEDEKNQELQAEAVMNSQTQMARVQSLLKLQNKKDGD